MTQRKIKKVEVAALFWKDLSDLRKHPDYHKIRSNIGSLVKKVMNGEPGGDVPFRGNPAWEDVRHLHVGSKLVVFTVYPDDETIRICALKKHDFYGFKRERKSMAANAAMVIIRSAIKQAQAFPDWNKITWKDPSELHDNPELRELSREALDALYQDVVEEGETFAKLSKTIEGMSDKNAERIADAWIQDLLVAEAKVQSIILMRARHRQENTPAPVFTDWIDSTSP